MTDSPVVGSASFELRVDKRKAKQDIHEFERDLKGSLGQMEGDATRSTGRIGQAFSKIGALASVGLGALTAGVGAALAGMTRLSFEALRFADNIANSAQKIGVGTNALQEWRYVAQKTGEDATAADRALDSFSTKLSQAAAGTSKDAVKAFGFLGLRPEDLKAFDSVEGALDEVVDRIRDLKNEADRAAVAEALGLGPLSAALRDGALDIAALRDEAHSLGLVMDAEMIRRASQAQDEFDSLARIIDVQLKGAFVDLAPAILEAIRLVAQLATALSDTLDQWRDLDRRTNRGLVQERDKLVRERDTIVQNFGTGRLDGRAVVGRPVEGQTYNNPLPISAMTGRAPRLPSAGVDPTFGLGWGLNGARPGERPRQQYLDAGEHFDNLNRRIAQIDAERAERAELDRPLRTNRPTGGSLIIPPERTPRTPVDRSAEREARRAERVEQEIYRAKQRLLDVAEGDLLTAQERWDLARDQLEMDREARDAEIASKVQRKEITVEEERKLRAAHETADALEDRVLLDNSLRDIRDEELASARLLADLTADLLSLQSGSARTARERERIELELLEITQRQRRAALDAELDKRPELTDADRQRIWDEQGRVDQAEREAVARRNMSPLERWRDESLKTADEIAEAYESVAARGLDALNDGLVDAIMNSKSLGDVFSNVAKQILADLLKISLRQGIIEPLAGALFPGGGIGGQGNAGSGGGVFGFLRSLLPRRASGDASWAGGMGVFNELGGELMTLPNGTQIIPHDVSMRMAAGAGQRQGATYVFEGNLMTPEFWARIQNGDMAAANHGRQYGASDGVRIVGATAGQQQRQQRAYRG